MPFQVVFTNHLSHVWERESLGLCHFLLTQVGKLIQEQEKEIPISWEPDASFKEGESVPVTSSLLLKGNMFFIKGYQIPRISNFSLEMLVRDDRSMKTRIQYQVFILNVARISFQTWKLSAIISLVQNSCTVATSGV